jgi:UDP-glucose 4-epimerase
VKDVARAHVQALHYLESHKCAEVFNLGTGTGTSMLDLVKAAERVLDKQINFEYDGRRMGDPPILVANAEKAEQILQWTPQKSLEQIILDSWNWENASHNPIS